MKTSQLKKIVASVVTLAMSTQALAGLPQNKLVLPSDTRAMLEDIAKAGRAQDLTRLVTPEVTRVILDYSKMKDADIRNIGNPVAATPAALGGAAAAGATAAVVEHLWDKYVGNDRSVIEKYDDDSFDVQAAFAAQVAAAQVRTAHMQAHFGYPNLPVNDSMALRSDMMRYVGGNNRPPRVTTVFPVDVTNVALINPTTTDLIKIHQRNVRNMIPRGEDAIALLVAEAAAGALAYKAAEWALDKYGGRSVVNIPMINERQFDLGVIHR